MSFNRTSQIYFFRDLSFYERSIQFLNDNSHQDVANLAQSKPKILAGKRPESGSAINGRKSRFSNFDSNLDNKQHKTLESYPNGRKESSKEVEKSIKEISGLEIPKPPKKKLSRVKVINTAKQFSSHEISDDSSPSISPTNRYRLKRNRVFKLVPKSAQHGNAKKYHRNDQEPPSRPLSFNYRTAFTIRPTTATEIRPNTIRSAKPRNPQKALKKYICRNYAPKSATQRARRVMFKTYRRPRTEAEALRETFHRGYKSFTNYDWKKVSALTKEKQRRGRNNGYLVRKREEKRRAEEVLEKTDLSKLIGLETLRGLESGSLDSLDSAGSVGRRGRGMYPLSILKQIFSN